jgi:hypothetical protein
MYAFYMHQGPPLAGRTTRRWSLGQGLPTRAVLVRRKEEFLLELGLPPLGLEGGEEFG